MLKLLLARSVAYPQLQGLSIRRSNSALQVQDKYSADKAMRVLWLLLAARAHAFLAPASRRACVRPRSIEEDLTAELDAVAEGAEEARYSIEEEFIAELDATAETEEDAEEEAPGASGASSSALVMHASVDDFFS